MTTCVAGVITAHVVETELDDGRVSARVQIRYGSTIVGTYDADGYPFMFGNAEAALEEFVAGKLRQVFGAS